MAMRHLLLVCFISILCTNCTLNNVKIDNSLSTYFKENNVEGCFALFNNGTGDFTVYNMPRYRDSMYLPASTFKIVNSLIGLQTGVISSDTMVIKWDSLVRPVPEWNKDLTMYEAFRVSAVPYYQEVARRIGKDTMQFWLDSLSYGTEKIRGPIDSFWLNNTLKIHPDEQLGLVKQLYFDQLPFYQIHQQTVKKAMLMEDQTAYRLSYKTGLGKRENGHPLAWIVGWIEENRHPYFFVLNIESADPAADMITIRMKILKDILRTLGYMQGKG